MDDILELKIKKIDALETHISKIENNVVNIDNKLETIIKSLVGDEKLGNIGVVERLKVLEKNILELEKEILELKRTKVQTDIYFKIIIFCWSIITTGVIGILVKKIFL